MIAGDVTLTVVVVGTRTLRATTGESESPKFPEPA
jgi:hypothetical protein